MRPRYLLLIAGCMILPAELGDSATARGQTRRSPFAVPTTNFRPSMFPLNSVSPSLFPINNSLLNFGGFNFNNLRSPINYARLLPLYGYAYSARYGYNPLYGYNSLYNYGLNYPTYGFGNGYTSTSYRARYSRSRGDYEPREPGYEARNRDLSADAGSVIRLKDNAFEPGTLTVKVGTTVRWDNKGYLRHTITADDGSFDSGEMAVGESFRHTFTEAGAFGYHCKIRRELRGIIVVEP